MCKIIVNIHSRLVLSPHSVLECGKVGFLKFVSIFGQKLRHLFLKKKVMYRYCSTLKCNYNALCFIGFDQVLREQLEVQILASSDVGKSHFEL
jgi:hypothetical protein